MLQVTNFLTLITVAIWHWRRSWIERSVRSDCVSVQFLSHLSSTLVYSARVDERILVMTGSLLESLRLCFPWNRKAQTSVSRTCPCSVRVRRKSTICSLDRWQLLGNNTCITTPRTCARHANALYATFHSPLSVVSCYSFYIKHTSHSFRKFMLKKQILCGNVYL